MVIEHNGFEMNTLRRDKYTEEETSKAKWVKEYLEPMMKTARSDIYDVKYYVTEDGTELVLVGYDNEGFLYETVNVSADSKSGIAYDVIRKIF